MIWATMHLNTKQLHRYALVDINFLGLPVYAITLRGIWNQYTDAHSCALLSKYRLINFLFVSGLRFVICFYNVYDERCVCDNDTSGQE